MKFAEDGVMLAVDGFASSSWSIRNAAQILLGVYEVFTEVCSKRFEFHDFQVDVAGKLIISKFNCEIFMCCRF